VQARLVPVPVSQVKVLLSTTRLVGKASSIVLELDSSVASLKLTSKLTCVWIALLDLETKRSDKLFVTCEPIPEASIEPYSM